MASIEPEVFGQPTTKKTTAKKRATKPATKPTIAKPKTKLRKKPGPRVNGETPAKPNQNVVQVGNGVTVAMDKTKHADMKKRASKLGMKISHLYLVAVSLIRAMSDDEILTRYKDLTSKPARSKTGAKTKSVSRKAPKKS